MKKICIICGKPTENEKSIEHIFPRAMHKWARYNLPKEEYEKVHTLLESKANRDVSHKLCNVDKQDAIPILSSLIFTEKKQIEVNNLAQQLEKYVIWYEDSKHRLLESQGGKCYDCGKSLETGILRRINDNKPRTWDNGKVICASCNMEG